MSGAYNMKVEDEYINRELELFLLSQRNILRDMITDILVFNNHSNLFYMDQLETLVASVEHTKMEFEKALK